MPGWSKGARLCFCWSLWSLLLGCQLEEVILPLPAHEGMASCFLAIDNHKTDEWRVEALALDGSAPIFTSAIKGARIVMLLYPKSVAELVATPVCELLPPARIFSREVIDGGEWIEEAAVSPALRGKLIPEGETCRPIEPCTPFEVTELTTFRYPLEVKVVIPQPDGTAWVFAGSDNMGDAFVLDAERRLSPMAWPGPSFPIGGLALKDGRSVWVTFDGDIFYGGSGQTSVRATSSRTALSLRAWLAQAETNDDLYIVVSDGEVGRLYRLVGDVLTELDDWIDDKTHSAIIPFGEGVRFLRPRLSLITVRPGRMIDEPISLANDEIVFGLGRLRDGTTLVFSDEGPVYWENSGLFSPFPDLGDYRLVRVSVTAPYLGGVVVVSGVGDFCEWRPGGGFCDRTQLTRLGLRTLVPWGGGFVLGSQSGPESLATLYFARPLP